MNFINFSKPSKSGAGNFQKQMIISPDSNHNLLYFISLTTPTRSRKSILEFSRRQKINGKTIQMLEDLPKTLRSQTNIKCTSKSTGREVRICYLLILQNLILVISISRNGLLKACVRFITKQSQN